MNNQVNKRYIRRQFEQISREKKLYHNSNQVFVQAPQLIVTSKDAEDYLTGRTYGFKSKLIHFAFKHKDKIKRLPIIGKIIIKKKNDMIKLSLNNENSKKSIRLDSIIGLYFDDFISAAYNLLLGREPDPQGILEFRQHYYLGANNEAIAYLLIISDEFNNRYDVLNIDKYRMEYKKYKNRRKWLKVPIIKRMVLLNSLLRRINIIYNDINYTKKKLNETLLRFENGNNEIEAINSLASNIEKMFVYTNTSIDKISNDINEVESSIQHKLEEVSIKIKNNYIDFNDKLDNNSQAILNINTAISQKLDMLPNFLAQNNLKNKSMITSLPGGVLAVQAGDYIMGIPSEEWGLAMFLSLNGHFEPGSEHVFCELLREGMTVIDVGANLGIYTLHALKLGCKVYSYEPTPSTYDLLNQNIKVNGFLESKRAFTFNYAVGDREKTVKFSICQGISGHNHISGQEETSNTIDVPVVSLDQQHQGEKIDFIKIDIEGSEYEAFKGMKNIIEHNPQIMILMEFAPEYIKRAGYEPQELLNLIKEYGLSMQMIEENTSQLCEVDESKILNEVSVNLLLSHKR